jgi:hypothetical protein
MKKTLIALLIGAGAIMGGVLWLYQSSKPHYDHFVQINGKKLVDINLALPGDSSEITKQVKFYVPVEYAPRITEGYVGQRLPTFFSFYFHYPSKEPYPNAESIVPQRDMIHVFVERHPSRKSMRSESVFRGLQENGIDIANRRYFVERRGYLDFYQYELGRDKNLTTGTLMIFLDESNLPVVIDNSVEGVWQRDVTRSYNDHIEMRYSIAKDLGSDIKVIDRAIVDVVKSFQSNR